MTEKRYYEKDYDELYYIFDSKTLSEKEFEKKVEYDGYDVFADSLTSKEVVDLLNELHEENEELKKENEQLQKYVYHCPQTCRIILAYLNKCGSENVEAVNNAMDIDEYVDEEIDTLK